MLFHNGLKELQLENFYVLWYPEILQWILMEMIHIAIDVPSLYCLVKDLCRYGRNTWFWLLQLRGNLVILQKLNQSL